MGAPSSKPEYEITDTQAFAENRYFDVEVEYAKVGPDDILIQITDHQSRSRSGHGSMSCPPFGFATPGRGGHSPRTRPVRPELYRRGDSGLIVADHATLGTFSLSCSIPSNHPNFRDLLFTENETNLQRLFNAPQPKARIVKDAFHEFGHPRKKGSGESCPIVRHKISRSTTKWNWRREASGVS